MKWEHKCSLEWLKDRQRYITASDIKKLLPVTKTGKPRTVSIADYISVMASKMVRLTEEDCMSYGAAARGHIMEPYAIEALNNMLAATTGEVFYWWDDKVVSLPKRKLAFSPDAMNVPMTNNYEAPSALAEVKSYSDQKHLTTAYTPKDQIEERWQIASAMALLENIDHAYLVLFNPRMKFRKTFVIRYDRGELEDEIEIVRMVEKNWCEFITDGSMSRKLDNGGIFSSYGGNEETIAKEVEARQRLNP